MTISHAADLRERLQDALGTGYRIDREVGGGGMSRVFAVRDTTLNRDIVVKVLPPDLAGEVSVERFKREIQIAASLQHPHIVPLHAAGDVDGLPYYMMPLVEGESLRDRLARVQRLSVGEAMTILRDIARALAYAHRRGIVHRDIKPENVLVHDGVAVVTDFGIAKAIAAAREDERDEGSPAAAPQGTGLTMTGTSLGTPSYMAPEQAAGDPRTDHRADLYALGVVGYELLAGRPPFHGRTPREQLTAQLAERPRELADLRLDIPPAVSALVMRALEKDPEARPQSADQMVRALDAALTGAPAAITAEEPANIRRAFALYAAAFVAAAGIAWAAMRGIGLPDWVFPGTMVVMALVLPVVIFTAMSRYAAFQAAIGTSAQRSGSLIWQNPFGERGLRAAQYLSWRRVAAGGALSLGSFGVLVAGLMWSRASGIGPAASLLSRGQIAAHQQILVTDFGAAPQDSTLARLAAEAVRVGLEQSNVVAAISPAAMADAMRRMRREPSERLTLQLAREVAAREGIGVIADGDLVRSGAGFVLTVRLVAADSGKTLVSQSAVAAGPEALVTSVDRVTRQLRAKIGESIKAVRRSAPLEQVTTASLPALELFAAARRAQLVEHDMPKAASLFKQVVAIDSEFASAWRALAIVLANTRKEPALRIEAASRAYRFRGRATENERLVIEGTYFSTGGPDADIEKAIAAYEALSARTGEPGNNLAWLLIFRREFARSESLYRVLVKQDPHIADYYDGFIRSLMMQGKEREADSIARVARDRFPEVADVRMWAARVKCGRRLFNECDAALDSIGPTSQLGVRAKMAMLRGQLAKSLRYSREAGIAQGSKLPTMGDVMRAAAMDVAVRRQPARAVARLDSLGDSVPRDWLLLVAQIYAWAGRPDRAHPLVRRWEREVPDTSRAPSQRRTLMEVRADIAVAEGRPLEVLDDYRVVDRHAPCCMNPKFLPLALALAFEAAGAADSTIAWYETFLTTPEYIPNGWGPGELYQARALERLGALHEEKGNRAKAVDYYSRFVELWKDADPELQPRVADARARIARLTRG